MTTLRFLGNKVYIDCTGFCAGLKDVQSLVELIKLNMRIWQYCFFTLENNSVLFVTEVNYLSEEFYNYFHIHRFQTWYECSESDGFFKT